MGSGEIFAATALLLPARDCVLLGPCPKRAEGAGSAQGVIGAGQLGRQCVRAVSLVREFDKIYLYDVAESIARQAAADLAVNGLI